MKLVAVEATIAPADLDTALALLTTEAETVRAMPGCEHYTLYANAARDGVAIVQKWTDMTAFDAYRTGDTFAKLVGGLRPLMTAPPVTTVAEVDSL